MKGYVKQALQEFQHLHDKRHHNVPSHMPKPAYRQRIQYVQHDESDPMTASDILHKQRVCGKFLFYARAIDNTMLHTLNDIASSKTPKTVPPQSNTSSTMLQAIQKQKSSTEPLT